MTEHRHGGAPIPQNPDGKDPAKDGEKKDADWGLSDKKPGMSRETKIGLALVVVLVAAFGFVVFKKIQQRNELFTDDPDNSGESYVSKRHSHDHSHGRKSDGHVLPSYDGRKKPAPFPDDDHHGHNHGQTQTTGLFGQQNEPGVHDGHNHNEGNPFDQKPRRKRKFDPDALTETSISGMTWIFTQPPPPPPAPHPDENPWNLDGGGNSNTAKTNQSNPAGNPFAQSGNSGGTPSFENTPGLNDGFRNADSAGTGKVQVFPADHRHSHDGHQHGNSTGTTDLFPAGGSKSVGTSQFPNNKQSSPFGQNQNQQHSHGNQDFFQTPKQDDRRLGAFQVGTGGQSSGGSSTHVHGQTSNELEYPFGKPANTGTKSPYDTPRKRRGFKPAPAPEPVDGHHHFANGEPVGPVDYSADRPTVHTVAYGENYWSISQKAYGAGKYSQALAVYNSYRIPDPRKMRPGMKVLVPPIDILAKRHPKLCPGHGGGEHSHGTGHTELASGYFRTTDGRAMYRVGKTDTLSDIAQKHLGRASRWIQIYRMNERLIPDPNRLKIGTELILPADASRVSLVPTPTRYR